MAVEETTAIASDQWLASFVERSGRHGDLAVTGARPPQALVGPLGRSIGTFQLGESGTGEHLLAAARRAGANAEYIESLRLFVAEEQEHARLLALVLRDLRAPLRTRHWSDRAFVLVRRLHSLRTEVLVLLVAEVIALTYYSSLRDGIGDPTLREVFARIHADEVFHVEFHCETLPPHLDRLPRRLSVLARVVWNVLVTAASIVVAIDHGRLLRHLGVSRRSLVKRVWNDRRDVAGRLFSAV